MFDWLTRKKLSSVAEMVPSETEGAFRYSEEAERDPDCKACNQGWPIHTDGKKRVHIDVVGFHKDYGFMQPCPTQNWPEEGEEEASNTEETKNEDTE